MGGVSASEGTGEGMLVTMWRLVGYNKSVVVDGGVEVKLSVRVVLLVTVGWLEVDNGPVGRGEKVAS